MQTGTALLALKELQQYQCQSFRSPEALCPNVKEGFGASAVVVSSLSADLPKVNVGGGCSVGALGLQKEKPPEVTVVGAASPSLQAAPKRKADGAEEVVASFFPSGFPKVNVGAAGSLSASKDPNVEPPCGVVVAKLGSPNLPNTDPVVLVVVGVELVFIDMLFFDDATLSLFS